METQKGLLGVLSKLNFKDYVEVMVVPQRVGESSVSLFYQHIRERDMEHNSCVQFQVLRCI